MDREPKVGQRPIELRVSGTVSKSTLILEEVAPGFQEFADVIRKVQLALTGLTRYLWHFTSHEHEKLIRAMRIKDDFSKNVTEIGQEVKKHAAGEDLTLKQKKVLDQIYYILKRCLQDALELYEESERELILQGVKIHMSDSDGYGEHERLNASLWPFQREFHRRQLDTSRGSNKAIIYPPSGFHNNGSSSQGSNLAKDKNSGIMTEQDQVNFQKFLKALNQPHIQDLLNGKGNNPDGSNGYKHIPAPVPPPKVPPKVPQNEVPGILKNGTLGEKGTKTVHWPDSDSIELPSPSASDDAPPPHAGDTEKDSQPTRVPDTVPPRQPVAVPQDQTSRPPPTLFGGKTFSPPSSPISISSSDSETPPSTPPSSQTNGGDSPEDTSVPGAAEREPDTPNDHSLPTSPTPSSSSTLPSGSSTPAIEEFSDTEDEDADENVQEASMWGLPRYIERLKDIFRKGPTKTAKDPAATRNQVALAIRAYLGPRHDEYSTALSVLTTRKYASLKRKREWQRERLGIEEPLSTQERPLEPVISQRNVHAVFDVKTTALLHWAGVRRARRQERTDGRRRLRAFLKWAEKEGKIPLSPSSIRASTGLRRGLFEPLDLPEPPQPPPKKRRKKEEEDEEHSSKSPDAYREAALADLTDLQPRLDISWVGFLFNQDALRLFGGLVGEQPLPRDLRRMDRLLRELEVYTAVCEHRRTLVVGHLKRMRSFPTALGAQFGDLQCALQDAEEDKLSAACRAFTYVAERSRRVMTYPGSRVKREFCGVFDGDDREKLEYLGEIGEDGAEALLAELEAAERWLAWSERAIADWNGGWRPARVETDALYVGEDTEADMRRYKREINQKRDAIGLVPLGKRPLDGVYERQQGHITSLDALWSLTSSSPVSTDQ